MNTETFNKLLSQHQAHAAGKCFIPPTLPSLASSNTNYAHKKGCSLDLTAFGRTQSVGAWSREYGKARDTIMRRIKTMTLEEALTRPSRTGKKTSI